MENKQFLTLAEVLIICSISRATLYRWIKLGEFPAQYLLTPSGRTARWKTSEIEQWCALCMKKGGR
ncbi:AlpA family phage regulatory protein [Providencia sp. R33]|uniref:helix-turn-helix transcriptional regulator n=1 Tax=Providencia sp. R33 TaxID=2828763 RepID=UPI001C5A936C|nr:AlpA family phage regulatory protein [Providencia sp. R33]QXX84391.1 AlpA family phage regulatory protein [Providencia sp. R33]